MRQEYNVEIKLDYVADMRYFITVEPIELYQKRKRAKEEYKKKLLKGDA